MPQTRSSGGMGQELACCAGRRHGGDHDARQPPPALSPEVVQTFKRMRRASTRAGDIPMHTYRAEYRMKRRSASALPARRPVELHDPGSLVGGIHRDGRGEFVARFPNPAFVSPLAPSPRSSSPSAGWATPSPRGSESPRCPPLHVGPEHARRAAATAEGMTGNLEGGAEDVEDLGGVELPMEEVEGPSAGAAGLVVHVPAAPEANPDLSTMRRNSDCSPMSSPGFRPAPPLETAHGCVWRVHRTARLRRSTRRPRPALALPSAEADDPIPPDAMDNLVCMEASTQGWTPLITGRRPAHLRLYRMEVRAACWLCSHAPCASLVRGQAPDDTPGTLRVKYFVALPDHDPDTVYRFLFDLDLRCVRAAACVRALPRAA